MVSHYRWGEGGESNSTRLLSFFKRPPLSLFPRKPSILTNGRRTFIKKNENNENYK